MLLEEPLVDSVIKKIIKECVERRATLCSREPLSDGGEAAHLARWAGKRHSHQPFLAVGEGEGTDGPV